MIKRCLFAAILMTLLVSSSVYAVESEVSKVEKKTLTRGLIKDELFSIKPLTGVFAYDDGQGHTATRLNVGLAVDMNFTRASTQLSNEWYGGLSSGLVYSHLGDPGSNFFGNASDLPLGYQSAYLFLIPVNTKIGFAPSDFYRISLHAGANVIYRSLNQSINLSDSAAISGSSWLLRPNFGFDLDVAINRNISITLRPDWTLSSGTNLFTGTLALGFFLS